MPTHVQEMTENIVATDTRGTTDAFCRLVIEGKRLPELIVAGLGAAAPYLNVPAHTMIRPDGDLKGVNYDHTVMGVRGSLAMMSALPNKLQLLPMTQAFWYLPDGLDIWDQLLCEQPGHYARENEKCPVLPESEPQVHFADQPAIRDGSVDDRFHRWLSSTMLGDRTESYRLFLGLAEEPEYRERLKEQLLFLSIIDIQDTIIGPHKRKIQNIGHKSFRARALIDIADYVGWENAHHVFYGIVPDFACWPRFYDLWGEMSAKVPQIFGPEWNALKQVNQEHMTVEERDRTMDVIVHATSAEEVKDQITALLKRGVRFTDIAQAVVLGHAAYVMEVADNSRSFFTTGHAFDYCNVVHYWIRRFDNPNQVKGLYFMAVFLNDAIQATLLAGAGFLSDLEPPAGHRAWAAGLTRQETLVELDNAIAQLQSGKATALTDAYVDRFSERQDLIATLAKGAARFQADPHMQRNAASSQEEWTNNTIGNRDLILRAQARYLASGKKRTMSPDCFNLFHDFFGK
ncbi:MAG TPA: hypothetical protein VMW65_02275 [Chloroflexota bacterium]|nr:hypothetical protein [Chloroflexota bacterium]